MAGSVEIWETPEQIRARQRQMTIVGISDEKDVPAVMSELLDAGLSPNSLGFKDGRIVHAAFPGGVTPGDFVIIDDESVLVMNHDQKERFLMEQTMEKR